MVKTIYTDFKFHPIGQGCFYTGSFGFDRFCPEFYMVYDCGVSGDKKNMYESIKSFRSKLKKQPLNVLFLSHLDSDHVNGVKQLLEGLKCENIYLPYLTPIQRLYLAIQYNDTDNNSRNDYISFLQNPHEYLHNIEGSSTNKIVYILGNSNISFNSDNRNRRPNSEGIVFEFEDYLEGVRFDEYPAEIKDFIDKDRKNINIEFKKGNQFIRLGKIWEFYLYHETANEGSIKNFITETINSLYDSKISMPLTQEDLVTILKDKKTLKTLRKKINDFILKFKPLDINITSLLLHHKPIGYKTAHLVKLTQSHSFNHNFNSSCGRLGRNVHINYGNYRNYYSLEDYKWGISLLTGDIGLNQIEKSDYIKDHLEDVLIFQVPHHGSEEGWDNSYLRKLNYYNGMTSAIISFGYGNTYGHPRQIVLEDLNKNNFDICFCNQFASFNYQITLGF